MSEDCNRNYINHQFKRRVKVTLSGDAHVGRNSFLKTVVAGLEDFVPDGNESVTVGMPHILDGSRNQINLELDMSLGRNKFKYRIDYSYRKSFAVFILFDLTDIGSFNNVRNWAIEAARFAQDAVVIVVGNKSDLHDERVVTTEEARALAESAGANHYYETNMFNPEQKSTFERVLIAALYEFDSGVDNTLLMPININNKNVKNCSMIPFTECQPPANLTNLQMSKFRLVMNNKLISQVIFEYITKIHHSLRLKVGLFSDDNFLCNQRYYNVLAYKAAKNIPLSAIAGLPSFFVMLKCPDTEFIKKLINTLNLKELEYHGVRISDELMIREDIPLLKWLFKEKELRCSKKSISHAIIMGNLDLIKLIIKTHSKKSKIKFTDQFTELSDNERINFAEFAKVHKHPEAEKYFKSYLLAKSTFINKIKTKITN